MYSEIIPSTISSKLNIDSNSSNDLKNSSHYLCPTCHTFPKLILKENRKIYIYCKDIKGGEMDLKDYMEYKLTKGDIKEYTFSEPNKEYIGYCFDCKINFSKNNSNEHKTHNNKHFEDMLIFIKNKLKFPDNKEFSNPESFLNSNQNNKIDDTNVYENGKDSGIIIKVEKKNFIDNLFTNNPFSDVIQIIIQDLKLYPNNIHYENIKTIFCFLSEQLEIEYHNFATQSLDIRIFGENFVENNSNNFILFMDGKEEKLKEIVQVKGLNETLKIKLVKINETTDLSEMFYDCEGLKKINIINGWNTSNVTTMSGMFYGCKALEYLPDISKWKTNNVTDFSSMFEECEILERLPDISKWNVENVKSMSSMFSGCESLEQLPDLSKWNTNNLETIYSMFQNCKVLISLNGLESWNTSKITNMGYAFQNCKSLTDLGDISKWNTENVTSFSNMFDKCKSLTRLPDLSKWNTQNVTIMCYMFSKCKMLESIPEISLWNVQNVKYMNNMFENCSNLKLFPDISKWNKNKDLDSSFMFKGCDSLKNIPNL